MLLVQKHCVMSLKVPVTFLKHFETESLKGCISSVIPHTADGCFVLICLWAVEVEEENGIAWNGKGGGVWYTQEIVGSLPSDYRCSLRLVLALLCTSAVIPLRFG